MNEHYHLLPFKFENLGNTEVLINEVGDFLFAPRGTVSRIIGRSISKTEDIYKDLLSRFFISESPIPELIDNYAVRLRTKKAFLDDFTSLHIFVLTLRCNQNCIYCQASSKSSCADGLDMSREDLICAINLMFKSPSPSITMEFQGGEPTLAFELLKFAVEQTEKVNKEAKKSITYVLCSNCVGLNEEILTFCKNYNILISTSLDGPEALHNTNRGKSDSCSKVIAGINAAKKYLGEDKVSPLMTTSELSLNYPEEIVESYIANGFSGIFIRPLNPYGLASKSTSWELYYDKFIAFYIKALDYIIELNKQGKFFVEDFTAIILKKILTPFAIGFVDLQSPAGIINSVIAYNYNGYVYASDESRMLSELGDETFRMGHVSEKYEDIFYGKKAQDISKIWATETIAGCSDCAFQNYCGADPVRNHSTQDDMYGFRPTSLFCKKHKAIISHILILIRDRGKEVMPIFLSWIKKNEI